MLQVKTYVAKSKIKNAGIGLFADQNIRKGQLVWVFEEPDMMFDLSDLSSVDALSPHLKEFIRKYGYIETYETVKKVIVCFDNGRFVNHSSKPTLDDSVLLRSYAARDIKIGEELTSDYRWLPTVK